MAKRILVTGATGQLGQCIKELQGKNSFAFIFATRDEVDLEQLETSIAFLETHQPDVIVNCAAYTQVDKAEEEKEKAFAVNAYGVKSLANYCAQHDIALVHISTDYVFDGNANEPYGENETTHPVTVYGKSKLKGEQYIQEANLSRYWIIRTSWLYSIYGHNFYKTMVRLGQDRDALNVVNDQLGRPTSAHTLAVAIIELLENMNAPNGVYHYSNIGVASWYDFANEIFRLTKAQVTVHPVDSTQFPTAAQRPAYSVLGVDKIQPYLNQPIKSWQEALAEVVTK